MRIERIVLKDHRNVAILRSKIIGTPAAGTAGLARGLTKAPPYEYITERRRKMAPFAHILFCSRNQGECKLGAGSSVVTLTDEADRELRSVNSDVNRSIIKVNDAFDSPVDDVWQVNVKSGDCEDFALTKRDHLNAIKGWRETDLRWLMIQSGEDPRVWYEL